MSFSMILIAMCVVLPVESDLSDLSHVGADGAPRVVASCCSSQYELQCRDLYFRTIADLDLNARVPFGDILSKSAQSCRNRPTRSSHFDASHNFRHSDKEAVAFSKQRIELCATVEFVISKNMPFATS
jgi:hypothetical protein